MFVDQKVKVTDLGKVLPKLSPTGVNSVGKYLGFSTGVIKALEKKNLMDVVLAEIEKRNPEDECMLRSYKDVPVGIPSGMDADGINHHLASKFFDTSKILAPYTMLEYTHHTQEELEFLPKDIFKMEYTGWVDLLTSRVTNTVDLLRMFCSNRSVVKEKSFIRKCGLKEFDPQFAHFEALRAEYTPKIKHYIENMNKEKATVATLGVITSVANEINSKELKLDMKERAILSLDVYEIPHSIKSKKKDDAEFNPLTFPETWKRTAVLEDSVYDIWNIATREITQREQHKVLTPEKALKAHVMTGSLLRFTDKAPDLGVIVAERRRRAVRN